MSNTTKLTDVRCPTGSKSLLGRLVSDSHAPEGSMESLLVQLHCRECTKDFRRIHGSDTVLRVLHLYTITGEFKHTQIQFRDGADKDIDLETQIKLFKLSASFKRSVD